MQKLLLVLVALAGLAGLAYVLLPSGETDGGTTTSAATVDDRTAGDEDGPTSPTARDELTSVGAARSTGNGDPLAAADGLRMERLDAGEGPRIAGRVVLPDGLPADDQPQVRVHRERPRLGSAGTTALQLQARLEEAEVDSPLPMPPAWPVAADGSFEVELPADVDRAWLQLESRYLIAGEPLEVRADADPDAPATFEPELGAWIRVRLRLPAGADASLGSEAVERVRFRPNPLAAAGLRGARRAELFQPVTAVFTGDLDFEIRGLRCVAEGTLEITSDHFAAVKLGGLDPEPGSRLEADATLSFGATVSGRVVDDQGRPVPEAEILASIDPLMFGQGGFEVRDGESDDDGRFRLANVTPGKLKLSVSRDGYLEGSLDVEVLDGELRQDVELVLPTGTRVAGRVEWPDGEAVVGAEVDADFDASFLGGMEAMNAARGADGEAETDATGAFAITGLGQGPFVLQVSQMRDGRSWRARADAVRPGTEDVRLVLEEPLGVRGRVLDDLGQPLTKFEVMARTKTSGMLAGLGAETHGDSFEDEEGAFFLDGLRVGDWELIARAEGHARPVPVEVALPLGDGEDVRLVLPRAASASGMVLGPNGFPVEGAEVGMKLGLADIGRIGTDGLPPGTTSDELGRFALEGLPADAIELVATAPGYGDSAPLAVELEAGGVVLDLKLTLRIGGRILGLLLDDEGSPLPGESVLCQDPADPTSQRFVTTDNNGEFVIDDLAPGNYQVMTFGAGGDLEGEDGMSSFLSGMKLAMAEVEEGQDTEVTLGAVAEDPVQVTGTVTADGEPVSGTMVSFIADGNAGMEGLKFTTTDAAGSFSATLNGPGRYLVNVQTILGTGQQQTVEQLIDIPEAESHELALELPIGSISGRVTTPDGEPASGVRVTLAVDGPLANGSFSGGQYAEIVTDADGTYELRWLRPGTYSVAAGGAFLGGFFGDPNEDAWGRQVRRGLTLSEGQVLSGVDFALEEPGGIGGRVVDASGQPLGDAAIFLRDAEGNVLDRISMVRTDATGSFVYSSLQPGTYEVTARTGSSVSAEPVQVAVREGERSEVALTVDAGTLLLVSLTDREGEPVRCSVTVTGPDGRQVNGLYSYDDLMSLFSSGQFSTSEQRVGPLPPGKYRIEAVANDGRDARKTATLSGQETRRVRLRLD